MELGGSAALVTGAAQGIGKSYVDHLLQQHVKVMISDVNKTVGEDTRQELAKKYGEGNVKFVYCDVTNESQFEDTIKEVIRVFGKLDILINNAGIASELDPGWRKTIDVNFAGVVKGTYLGMKHMGKHMGGNGGTIVNIASLTTFTPFESAPVYAATKSAVNQFSRSIGTKLHYDRTGVRVISINPGLTDTAILKDAVQNTPPETKESLQSALSESMIQSVENMGKGLIQVLKIAKPGSMWVIEDEIAPKKLDFIVEKTEINI